MKVPATLAFVALCSSSLLAKNPGIFEAAEDIGAVKHKGTTVFENNIYTISGSGSNIWFDKDELHFAFRKLSGDFVVSSEVQFIGAGVDPHRKTGWMARVSTKDDAAMVCIAVHGDGLVAFQYRKQDKANIEEVKIPLKHAEVIRLERVGRSFFVYVTKGGIPFWSVEVPDFDLPQELMVGLFICSHNPDVIEKAQFTNTHVYTKVSPK